MAGGKGGYCRNPHGGGIPSWCTEPVPWCYTTNRNKRWEHCSIPICTGEHTTIIVYYRPYGVNIS